jgi:glycosyltransferase involved in cell wall biosynthesis
MSSLASAYKQPAPLCLAAMAKPLDVLHVTETLAHGGAEQNLLSILRRLPRDRFRHHLAWLYDDDVLLEAFRPHVTSLIPLHAGRGLGLAVTTVRLIKWMRQNRPDVVHTQLIRAEIVGRVAAFAAGRLPVVTTWQNTFYDDQALGEFGDSRARRALVRWLDRTTGLLDRRFIAVSGHVAAHCAAELSVSPERVRVIYNAIDPERCRAISRVELTGLRDSLGLPAGARVLLSVGRLVPQKGHVDLIDCLPSVLAEIPDVVLLIAGAGPLREPLQAKIDAAGLGGHARLLGARRDVPALYQLADAFVFPSRYEGLSVALVEAIANGLPTLTSDIPQNREVGDGVEGVTFLATGDAGAWARAIVEILRRGPIDRALTMTARTKVREAFSPILLAAQVGEELARAAGARHAGEGILH